VAIWKQQMITASEYRAWAEESLEFARTAVNESSREAYIKFAEIWLESALRVERLAALLEHPSKEPIPTTDYEWVLPPFGECGARALHSNEKAFRPVSLGCSKDEPAGSRRNIAKPPELLRKSD
jgi:hypothetical protein